MCVCVAHAYRMKSADQKPLSQDVNTRKARPAGGNVAVVAAVARVVDVLGSCLFVSF